MLLIRTMQIDLKLTKVQIFNFFNLLNFETSILLNGKVLRAVFAPKLCIIGSIIIESYKILKGANGIFGLLSKRFSLSLSLAHTFANEVDNPNFFLYCVRSLFWP